MKRFAFVLSLGILAFFQMADVAQACSPPLPGLSSSVPKDGETYPGNAALLFSGYEISLDLVAATIDGQPAKLSPAPSLGLYALAARIVPTPQKGQRVQIDGSFCPNCPSVSLAFTAGDADETPPPPASKIQYDVYDYADYKASVGNCLRDSDFAWYVRVDAEPPKERESRVVLRVEAFTDESYEEPFLTRALLISDSTSIIPIHATRDVAGGTTSTCFRATVQDLAGNEAAAVLNTCAPCRYRYEKGSSDMLPQEPMWKDGDFFAGGPCASGETSGGGTGSDSDTDPRRVGGCGCSVATEADHGVTLGLMGLLSLVALRRSSRRIPQMPKRR